MKCPRLFNGRTPTRALTLLRCCTNKGGYAPRFYPRSYQRGFEWTVLEEMAGCWCWVEKRRSGPRGGMRYHPTELGQVVLDLVTIHGPDYRVPMAMLGYKVR